MISFQKFVNKSYGFVKRNKTIIILTLLLILIFIFFFYKRSNRSFVENYNETILIDDCIYGKFKCFKGDKCICETIQKSGAWEKHILDLLIENYRENSNILDIGSNYGTHSIGMANDIRKNGKNCKNCKVHSFEVQPEILKLFKENIELNQLGEIIVVNEFGLGDKNEEKVFMTPTDYDQTENPGALGFEHNDSQQSQNQNVVIKRLDDLNLDNISLIKIDVEGFELEVFEGGRETIRKNKPVIIIEIWGRNKDKYFSWIGENFPFYEIQHISNEDYILKPMESFYSLF